MKLIKNSSSRNESETVRFSAPSGFVFEFHKPTLFAMAIRVEIPEYFAAEILESWANQGVIISQGLGEEIDGEPEDDLETKIQNLKLQIAELSHSPKIKIGAANPAKDEISIDDISNDDLLFLLFWVASGGSEIQKVFKLLRNSKKIFWIARAAGRSKCRPSHFYGLQNLGEITCASFDLFCDMRMGFYEAEQVKDNARLNWQTQVSAYNGKPLEFQGENSAFDDLPEAW